MGEGFAWPCFSRQAVGIIVSNTLCRVFWYHLSAAVRPVSPAAAFPRLGQAACKQQSPHHTPHSLQLSKSDI
jgi:hypothetical protein